MIQLNVENERAHTRPNSQARTGTGEKKKSCSADHEQDWQPYPVDPYSAEIADHTCTSLREMDPCPTRGSSCAYV